MIELQLFQKQALSYLLSPKIRHVVCISPTGSGKTKIVEKWVELSPKKTLFISPLIALNQQQKRRFDAARLGSMIDVKTPESIFTNNFGSSIDDYEQFVIDECHTVFEWGDRFRPALGKLPEVFSDKKALWLTATLSTPDVKRLIVSLSHPVKVLGRFSFSEKIKIETIWVNWIERFHFIIHLSYRLSGQGIIFCNSRKWCERIDRYLKLRGVASVYYHAGLSKEEKIIVENKIKEQKVKIIVSTIAFGLGMHIPEIKWGASWGFPGSYLGLSQMIGRVGRGHEGGVFYFLWSSEDEAVWSRKQNITEDQIKEFNNLSNGLKKGVPIRKIIESELI